MKWISRPRGLWLAYALLLIAGLGFRLFVALRLGNDTPDDGRVYSQIARNVLEQHVYSHESEPPYLPSLIRLPGYPLFLAGVYSVFGHNNNTAVRIVQALFDTGTCVLIALVAFYWSPDEKRRHSASVAAFLLAVVCPFTTIYVGTILTEVLTSFLAVAMTLAVTFAFTASSRRRALALWILSGVIAGVAVLFRPDSGLFAAAVGLTIVVFEFVRRGRPLSNKVSTVVWKGAVFSFAFCLVLVPWTIRNQRVFHLFQPLSPAHGEMPGEFVPRGYLAWLRSWLNDGRYIGPVLWSLDEAPINIDDFPDRAFDSDEERDRVAALLEKYNHPTDGESASAETAAADTQTPVPNGVSPTPSPTPDEESSGDENDEDNSESDDSQGSQDVEMTPDIDAGFAQIARERIQRSPIRYYVELPAQRAVSLWFDTHSQYYPFDGELFPLDDLDYAGHQQYWLPLFAGLTWLYSILGLAGAWILWRTKESQARRWVLLAGLIIFMRLGFFSSLENPEPRYTVELFPFLSILGGLALSRMVGLWGNSRVSRRAH